MSIKRERTKQNYVQDDSCLAAEDLTALNLCMVRATGAAANSNMTVSAPTGQGALVYAVLLNAPDEGEIAQLGESGIQEVRANEAFNSGVELTVSGTNGRVEAAASDDFVCGTAREASGGSGHCISMTVKHYYKP